MRLHGIVTALLLAYGGAAGASSRSAVDSDALRIEELPEFSLPARLRPDNPDWLAAYRALYDYPHADLSDPHMTELRRTMERVHKEQGEKFPAWVLDRIGTEVMLGNRIGMDPGLAPPRFRRVSYVDALMLPLSTTTERAASPDFQALYPHEEKLLGRYLADLHVARLPATDDGDADERREALQSGAEMSRPRGRSEER